MEPRNWPSLVFLTAFCVLGALRFGGAWTSLLVALIVLAALADLLWPRPDRREELQRPVQWKELALTVIVVIGIVAMVWLSDVVFDRIDPAHQTEVRYLGYDLLWSLAVPGSLWMRWRKGKKMAAVEDG